MKLIQLKLKDNQCDIRVGYDILPELGKYLKVLDVGEDAVIITNPLIRKLYGHKINFALEKFGFRVKIFTVPDGEKSKSAQMAFDLFNRIAQYDVQKRIFIITLGGGVVGDLGGFVASCYKRGVKYVQVPTTLLAQIDSAIGGKVAIDLPMGKNLVGAFYQPKLVFSDVNFLTTLSKRQIRNGLAEAIKYGMIYDRKFFEYIEKSYKKVLSLDPPNLTDLVMTCSRIKSEVVRQDEKETKGMRTILNFGHTIGHAIEAACLYNQYQHGEAIAIGMGIAADISHKMGLLSEEKVFRLKKLITLVGLPISLKGISVKKILKVMAHDKKFVGKKNRFVLVSDIGKVNVVDNIPLKIIEDSIKVYIV